MTPERWQQVQEIFLQARELSGAAVEAYMSQACGDDSDLRSQVQALLGADLASANPLDRPVARLTSPEAEEAVDENLGLQMGSYRLERLLGRGGMGSVYLAVRADGAYDQEAAIKVLRRGLDTEDFLRRFRLERQILAALDHPHIAKLLDGGTTEAGGPFLVMEYVDGKPIHEYCDENQLTVRQRLELFRKVCRAVHVAHQSLVVHRDLKPGNILVTDDGEPKLLDFSIAKLLSPGSEEAAEAMTQQGTALMTPAYASPEQMRGEPISTASDIYSLGVVLFELLAGCRPGNPGSGKGNAGSGRGNLGSGSGSSKGGSAASPSETDKPTPHGSGRDARRETGADLDSRSARRPSTAVSRLPLELRTEVGQQRRAEPDRLRRQLRGDLDNITSMALRPEPLRRYSSADQMAKDLERHLAGRPVLASGDSWGYRAMKLLRRHRLAASVAGLSLIALLAFVILLAQSRIQTLRQFERAEAVSDLLVELFEIADPGRARGEVVTARQILEDGVLKVRSELSDQPQAQADVEASMGRSFLNLGLLDQAEDLLQHSLDLRRGLHGQGHRDVASGLHRLSEVFEAQGRYKEATAAAREALLVRREVLGEAHPETAASHLQLARVLDLQGNTSSADDEFRQGVTVARQVDAQKVLAAGLDDYAISLRRRGDAEKAEALYREALEILRTLHGKDHPDVALSLNNLGLLLTESDPEAAMSLFREAQEIQRRLYPDGHLHLATTLSNLGLTSEQNGQSEAAEAFYREALEMQREAYQEDHPRLATTLNNLAGVRFSQGQAKEAEDLYLQSLAMRRKTLGTNHAETAASLNNLGELLAATGRTEEARERYQQALEISRSQLGAKHSQVAVILHNLGGLATASGDLEEARELYQQALNVMTEALGEDHYRVGIAVHNLAGVQRSLGEVEEAEQSFRRALSIFRQRLGEDHVDVGRVLVSLASLSGGSGDSEASLDWAQQARQILQPNLEATNPWMLAVERMLAESLLDLGRNKEAEVHLSAWHQGLVATRGAEDEEALEVLERLREVRSRK